ncbi:MAG: hypothetical protein E6G48_03520 [Actinobacteria bacterium]|nr:MAG: hypothetical protein E6G48_03520 [Actinomycetota bacterium]
MRRASRCSRKSSVMRRRGRLVPRSARAGRTPRPAARPAPARPRLEVWKLGGAALADAEAVRRAVGLVQRHPGDLVVVVSALKDVTDGLLEGAHRSASGDVAAASAQAAAFLRRHRALVLDLVAPGPDRRRLLSEANRAAREYREICRAVAACGHLSPRTSDVLVSRGERVAAAVVAAALCAAGRAAARVDALDVVSTDGHHGAAAPDLAETRRRARKALPALLAAPSVPRAWSCGRAYRASSPRTPATSRMRGSSPSSTTARRRRSRTSAPRSCIHALSSRSRGAGCGSTYGPSSVRRLRAPRCPPGARSAATR